MINLLNPSELRELKAARINVRLRRYATLTFVTLGIVGTIYAISFQLVSDSYGEAIAKSKLSEQQLASYEPIKTTAKEYRANLTIAKRILGSEIAFSDFIIELASSLPPNTILSDLNLSTKSIGVMDGGKRVATQLNARAKSYSDAIALKTNLEKKDNLFSEIRITSTSLSDITNSSDKLTRDYPYNVTLNAIIADQGVSR